MNNFEFYNPVNIVFGKSTIKELSRLIPTDKKIMMIYGGGSIKKNGVYDQVINSLKSHNFIEFTGIEPNPAYETCMEAVEIIKEKNIDFLLAVGGGSVIDATKFIAAAAKYEKKDPWDILAKGEEVKSALSLGCVLTLPATGSEMNANSVISRKSNNEKLPFNSPRVFPLFSILDPETTYSLPLKQLRNGIVDTFIHVIEQYITKDINTPLQDRQAEAIILSVIEEAQRIISDEKDYDTMANYMWAATSALNATISCGVVSDWSTHMIGHELTALYGIDHAQSLAIVLPELWRNQKSSKKEKLIQFGKRVFGVEEGSDEASIEKTIAKTEQFFHSIGMPTKLANYDIDATEAAAKIKERFNKRNFVCGENQDITGDVASEIINRCQ